MSDSGMLVSREKSFCGLPTMPARIFNSNIAPEREALIRVVANKWANGTTLNFYFFDQSSDGETVFFDDGTKVWRSWVTEDESQKQVVRDAFDAWKKVGIGLDFKEVATRGEAEI